MIYANYTSSQNDKSNFNKLYKIISKTSLNLINLKLELQLSNLGNSYCNLKKFSEKLLKQIPTSKSI